MRQLQEREEVEDILATAWSFFWLGRVSEGRIFDGWWNTGSFRLFAGELLQIKRKLFLLENTRPLMFNVNQQT